MKDRRQQILDAALDAFAEEGYHGASIKKIANRANLKSPALIYWYFENKEDLLKAVLTQLSPFIAQATDPEAIMERPPEEVLTLMAQMFMTSLESDRGEQLFRVFLCEAIHMPETVEHIVQGGPLIVLNAMTAYLEHQIQQGTLRPHNPESGARAFIGMLIIYLLGKVVLPPLGETLPPPDEYARNVVAIFLYGVHR